MKFKLIAYCFFLIVSDIGATNLEGKTISSEEVANIVNLQSDSAQNKIIVNSDLISQARSQSSSLAQQYLSEKVSASSRISTAQPVEENQYDELLDRILREQMEAENKSQEEEKPSLSQGRQRKCSHLRSKGENESPSSNKDEQSQSSSAWRPREPEAPDRLAV